MRRRRRVWGIPVILLAAGLAVSSALGASAARSAPAATPSGSAGASVQVAAAPAVPAGFVYRSGRTLMLDGAPYRFVGFNAFGMAGCATGTAWTDDQLAVYFDGLPAASMTRIWAFSRWGMAALDRIVAAAQARHQKMIFSLAEAGSGCESPAKDNAWYASGYQGSYLAWVRQVVTRFAGSPAIGMWEIINEPGHTSTVDATTMKAFLDGTAAVIKGIDPDHLVESGSMAEYAPGFAAFGTEHSGPDIDVGSLHEYDYSAANPLIVSHHLAPTLSALDAIAKPLIIGEVGISSGTDATCLPTLADRAAALRRKLDAYFLSGVAGVLIWNYTPTPSTTCGLSVRGTPADPALAMVSAYVPPTPPAPPVPSGTLVARHSGKCLDVVTAANRALLVQNSCTGVSSQRFSFAPTDGGFYRVVAANSGRCLDVYGQSIALKAVIQQWDCWNGLNQQFRFEPTDGGYYHLIARNSVMCLDVVSRGTADGTGVQQYDCGAGTNQQFRIG